jgi:hypothetical protein
VLGGRGTLRVGMSVQNELLGDKPEGFFDGLNLDLTSLTVLAFPHGNSKGEEPVREDVRWENGAQVVSMEAAVHFLCPLVAFSLGHIHCCRSNRLPRNVLQTLNFSHWGTAARVHNWFPGSRNMASNKEQKSRSVRACME